jgi:hypothetical protein
MKSKRNTVSAISSVQPPPGEFGKFNPWLGADKALSLRRAATQLRKPCLACDGLPERQTVERLERLAADRSWPGAERAGALAARFSELLPANPSHAGRYYTRRPMTKHADRAGYKWACDLRDAAFAANDPERLWFAEELLAGMPECVSNFQLECLCLLQDSDGQVTRLVRLKNVAGEMSRGMNLDGNEILDAHTFCNSRRFAKWCLARGNFLWTGGLAELRMLQAVVADSMAWRIYRPGVGRC